MKYLLDTHVLVWHLGGSRSLDRAHRRVIDHATAVGVRLGVCSVTLWEVAVLADRGRIALPMPVEQFLHTVEDHPAFEILPITASIALDGQRLGDGFPRDPIDRMIAATARCHGLTLLTVDALIIRARAVATR